MAYIDMYTELRGSVPNMPVPFAKTLINRAWADVRRQNLWSFQLFDKNWISPAVVNAGTATTVQGSSSVQLDATAKAALIAATTAFNPVNNRQFRVGISTICNIIAFDTTTGILTLDRGFPDPGGAGQAYSIFQIYYPAPYQDHLMFISVRDMVNFTDLMLDKNRAWLDEQDPQRTYYYFPTHVVPFMVGQESTVTTTYRYPLYELWGVPYTNRAYQLYGIRRGAELSANTDTLPPCISEECLISMAKFYAYEWAEANKGSMPRNQGPDYKFLMGATKARYNELFKKERQRDREFVDNWFRVRRSSLYGKFWAQYNSISGTAFPGAYLG